MLSKIFYSIILCLAILPLFAQYDDFDIDSIHIVEVSQDPNIDEQIYDVRIMNYLSETEREHLLYYFIDQERTLLLIQDEEINNNKNLIKRQVDNLETPNINEDFIYEANYDNEILTQVIRANKIENNSEVEEYSERTVYADFDQFDNPQSIKEYKTVPNEIENLKASLNLSYQHVDNNLTSITTEEINPITGEVKIKKTQSKIYNSDNQLIQEESYEFDSNGTEIFSGKSDYYYLPSGMVDYEISYISDANTTDLTDSEPNLKIENIYGPNNKLIEQHFSRITANQEYVLSDKIYFFRSNTTGVQENSLNNEKISVSNSAKNQIYVKIDELSQAQEYSIRILSQNGVEIYEAEISNVRNWEEFISVPTGIYFLNLVSKDGRFQNQKILVF